MSLSTHAETRDALLRVMISERRQLITVAKRILRCPHLAEDVVQDVAVKASRMEDCAVGCPARFAKCMVRNLAIDHARRRRRETTYAAPDADVDSIARLAPDSLSEIEARDALRRVFAALEELPDRTRDVFYRVRIEGCAQRTVASDLGVSPTLVNFMVQSAHRHCLARLQESGEALLDGPEAFARKRKELSKRKRQKPPSALAS
ncbi:RNA polymerase, sigma-24 subunit, ECF subfamily [Methylocella silvestris BL2]|uniref:RNA polymerase, sigma-24 subunit, ECF subfamily n=1 Tax=Methylocella silvestris (strain DSM 15510 / CIP 108128 / LMG 27833 / NCIMB 13906 / BL2) TaxID=395965 RepID=B8EQL6_METSB|nr:sigma-70 family RNA polymerase sigma factor [Methylocella silvestris]ACK52229.1 RNA polymerase, sigma-24 subunit, ECF subfamily [Methylocella silvestris BL2]